MTSRESLDYFYRVTKRAAGARCAQRRLGDATVAPKDVYRMNSINWLDSLAQDLRDASRSLRRAPVFTLAAVTTLALGIGINAAVFAVTNAVLVEGFPLVQGNDRLLYLASRGQGHGPFVSYPDFEDWRAQARSFEGMGAVNAVRISLSDRRGFPENCNGTQVSVNTFALLGRKPILGRDFVAADETSGAAPVAIVSHGFWERRYAKDRSIIGQTVRLNGIPTTVIGVMPAGFSFPRAQDLWLPLVPAAELRNRDARGLWFVFGRMAEGATVESVRAEMETIGRGLAAAYPRTNLGLLPAVHSFDEFFIGAHAATVYGSVSSAVACVFLIVCANLANLSLARAIGRSREVSMRIALGAGRWRIIRQVLTESMMLSVVAGVLGWLIAAWSVRIYAVTIPAPGWFDRVLDYSMDGRVASYVIALSIGSGLLFGLAPALRLSALDVNLTVKDAGRGVSSGRRASHLSTLLVIGEMAVAVVLLAVAGVTTRSVFNLYTTEIGVRTAGILASFVELPRDTYAHDNARRAFHDRLETRLREIPGVESVAIADRFPTQGARRLPYQLADAESAGSQPRPTLPVLIVGPGYFRTLEAGVIAGREFDAFDGAAGVPAAIVNQRLANRYWPGQDPLGKRLRLFDGSAPSPWLTIVGVVSNVLQGDITRPGFEPLVYLPYRQHPAAGMWLFARAGVPPASLAAAFRREVQALDSDLPLFDAAPLAARTAEAYRTPQLLGGTLLLCAAMALLLASIGLYAVIAHAVSQRTQELGIRTALGAATRDILTLVLRQGMAAVGIGSIIGLAAALALMPLLKSQLVDVSPADPVTLLAAVATLIVSALLACTIPARRAMRVDPVIALRHQ